MSEETYAEKYYLFTANRNPKKKNLEGTILDPITNTTVIRRIGSLKYGNRYRAAWELKCGVCYETFCLNTHQIRAKQRSPKNVTCGRCPEHRIHLFKLTYEIDLKL